MIEDFSMIFNSLMALQPLVTVEKNERRCNAIYNGESDFKKKNIGYYEGPCFDLVYNWYAKFNIKS